MTPFYRHGAPDEPYEIDGFDRKGENAQGRRGIRIPYAIWTLKKMNKYAAPPARPTRGEGALEGFLGRMRARMADRLIPDAARNGRILDVGCGTSPLFLLSTRFREKHGLDKSAAAETNVLSGEESLLIRRFDIENELALPYKDGFFDVVTMLAVFEHIEPERLAGVMGEARRVLKNNGLLILTTPAAWTDGLLRALARVGLVSAEEINEHKDTYTHKKIRRALVEAGFRGHIRCGRFEAGMNLWVTAAKQ